MKSPRGKWAQHCPCLPRAQQRGSSRVVALALLRGSPGGSWRLSHASALDTLWPPGALGKAGTAKPREGFRGGHGTWLQPRLCPGWGFCGSPLHAQEELRRLGASVSLFWQSPEALAPSREKFRGQTPASLVAPRAPWLASARLQMLPACPPRVAELTPPKCDCRSSGHTTPKYAAGVY